MNPTEINAVILDRLGRWQRFLRERNATPVIVIGLAHPDHQVVITTCEGIPDHLVLDALLAAVAAIRAGKVDQV